MGAHGMRRSNDPVRAAGRLMPLGAVAMLAASLTLGCDINTGSPTPTAAEPSTSSTSSPDASGSVPPDSSPGAEPAFDPARLTVALRRITGGLNQPVGVTGSGDGSGRLFVLEQPGRIRIVRDGRLVERPFLDISRLVSCCGERGLLGIAFPPHFEPATGTFYIDYTDLNGDTVIAAVTVDGADQDLADAGSLRPLLHIDQPYANHNGGGLAFGPDGFLYLGLGDGGGWAESDANADLREQHGRGGGECELHVRGRREPHGQQ